MIADVLGRRIVVPEIENAAALGGAKLVAGLERAPVAVPSAVYEPDAELHGVYAPLTQRYAEVFAGLRSTAAGPAA
jgi:sugar (pentulose or hexulose) kinase